ncbi:MAG: ComF family protein [Bacteroidales bacterium]|nr:ComF family protein [Bacteroidales bacterium]
MNTKALIILRDFLDLFLPRTCAACNRALNPWEEEICQLCLMQLPISNYHMDHNNPVAQVFWGRVRLEQASTWFIYMRGSRFQNLLHRLKYEHRPRIGIAMGKNYGYQLKHSGIYEIPHLIIPVPLHPKRQRSRGYNQSEVISRGLSIALEIPVRLDILLRTVHTKTQTAKTRAERYQNVSGKFQVNNHEAIQNKHILLVDDVITTGATIEACAEELLKIEGTRLSVIGVAYASKRS